MSEFKQRLLKKCKRGILSGHEIGYLNRISTDIAGLDYILGGGLPVGRAIQIWGPESAGKSALCLSIIKNRQRLNPEANFFYVDAEMTVTQEDLEVHNIDKDRLVFYRPVGGEDAIDAALEALMEGAEIAVIDSVPYLRPKKVLDELLKDSSYRDVSSIAQLLERVQSKIILTLEQSEGCLIFINQQRPAKDTYSPPSHPGGSALKFMLSASIQVFSSKKDKDNPEILTQGLITRKNKTHTPLKKTSLILDNRRVQRGQSLVETCLDLGLIIKKGGGYLFLEEDFATSINRETNLPRSVSKCGDYLETDLDLYNTLYKAVSERSSQHSLGFDDEQDTDDPNETVLAASIYDAE
jgi:recombination protein RecA